MDWSYSKNMRYKTQKFELYSINFEDLESIWVGIWVDVLFDWSSNERLFPMTRHRSKWKVDIHDFIYSNWKLSEKCQLWKEESNSKTHE